MVFATVHLLAVFPTALRPLNPSLHSLAVSLLCGEGRSSAEREAGSALFGSLYLLAPKGAQGLKDSWKMGVEALIGTIDSLVKLVTADVFSEGMFHFVSLLVTMETDALSRRRPDAEPHPRTAVAPSSALQLAHGRALPP